MFDSLTPGIAGTASVVLLALIFTSVWKLLSIMRKSNESNEILISDLRADCQWKDAQKAALVFTLQQAKLEVPGIAWQDRPRSRDRTKSK